MALRKPNRMPVMASRPMSAADYFAMPDTAERYELLEGELLLMPSPTFNHQDIVGEIFVALRAFARENGGRAGIAPLDVALSLSTVLQPDVIYISPERLAIARDHVEGAPDIVVEVASPSTQAFDRDRKLPTYALYGVREAWLVDVRARTVTVHEARDGQLIGSRAVRFGEPIPSQIASVGDAGLGAFDH